MSNSLLRTDKEIAEIYMRHCKTVYRVCFAFMKDPADTEDAVQDTFFRLIKSGPAFENEEHEKAWLIRTASNICKNMLRHWWRRRENIDDFHDLQSPKEMETDDVYQACQRRSFLTQKRRSKMTEISGLLSAGQLTAGLIAPVFRRSFSRYDCPRILTTCA